MQTTCLLALATHGLRQLTCQHTPGGPPREDPLRAKVVALLWAKIY